MTNITKHAERLQLDLEELALDHPSYYKEVQGILRNYQDALRREVNKVNSLELIKFMEYYRQYSIVKHKIENAITAEDRKQQEMFGGSGE